MKRYFYLAAAIAGLLMAASCQKESFGSLDGNYTDVLFTTEIPSGVATRAIADGTTVNKLYYEVYEVTGEGQTSVMGSSPVIDAVAAISGGSTTISVRLQRNKNYTAIFWAQYEPEPTPQDGESTASPYPYNVEDLRSIKVSYDNASANDETRDAFYAVVPNVEFSTTAYDVTLKRPFAQVNVATSDYEGISLKDVTSSLTITNVADTFYPLTDEATLSENGERSAIFSAAGIPDGFLTVANNNATYKYLAMAYVLVPTTSTETSTSISTISSDIYLNGSNTPPISVSYEGATLKQNHRTNLIGNILTGYTNFKIEVEEGFDNDNTYAVATYEDLAAAITNTEKTYKNITFTGDIAADAKISIPAGNTIILNLNGKTFTNNVGSERAFEITNDNVTFMVNAAGSEVIFGGSTTGFIRLTGTAKNANVTINGGTFTGTSANGTLIRFANQVDNNIVTLNNVNYTDNATLNTSGTTGSTQNAFVVFAENYNGMGTSNRLIVKGGNFKSSGGFVVPFDSEFDGAIITAEGTGLELKSTIDATTTDANTPTNYTLKDGAASHTVKNCTITLDPGAKIDKAPGVCIAASYSGIVTIENCTLNAPTDGTYALATWNSGGTITATGCRITSTENGKYKCDKGTITVDNVIVAEKTTSVTPQ